MNKSEMVELILKGRHNKKINRPEGKAFAPANIALSKYWGKRNAELNLPVTSSLSLSLGNKGTETLLSLTEQKYDEIILNNKSLDLDSAFAKRTVEFLNLFRSELNKHFRMITTNTIPTGTGLSSSASGFAALVLALDDLFMWDLDKISLSILARLGSGSACRSFWKGFVKWNAGTHEDGMDSYGEALPFTWLQLRVGILVLTQHPKRLNSRQAMTETKETSIFYKTWPQKVESDMEAIERSIAKQNFQLLGQVVESNALAMHALMMTAWPPIFYSIPETVEAMWKVWTARREGLPVYFTQDAGPNLVLLFLAKDEQAVKDRFPSLKIISPFATTHEQL